MIKEQTVLILGAGASEPYGLPLGSKLLNEILNGLSSSGHGFFRRLEELGNHPKDINSFHENLLHSDQPSVDAFLEHWPSFLKLGKQAIAAFLIPKEIKSAFSTRSTKGISWYQYLIGKLSVSSADELYENKLSIITFNYDRSFEYYLFKTLKHRYNLENKDCAEVVSSIPIIHVHGSLGNLPWQGTPAREYGQKKSTSNGPVISNEEIIEASEQIKVVSEAGKRSTEFEQAYQELCKATRIYFLGFGYYGPNLKKLRIKDGISHSQIDIYGTSIGIGKSDLILITEEWKINFKPSPSRIYDFLRDDVILR